MDVISRAATTAGAVEGSEFVVEAVPLKVLNDMPLEELAGKVVLDTDPRLRHAS